MRCNLNILIDYNKPISIHIYILSLDEINNITNFIIISKIELSFPLRIQNSLLHHISQQLVAKDKNKSRTKNHFLSHRDFLTQRMH